MIIFLNHLIPKVLLNTMTNTIKYLKVRIKIANVDNVF